MKTFLLLFSFSSLLSVVNAEVITLRADLWCPYTCDPKSDGPGFMVEIAQEIFKEAGHKVDYQLINWARAVSETKEGKFSGIVGAAKADAPDFIFPDSPIAVSSNYFWTTTKNNFVYKNNDSLKGKKIGVINSYTYGDVVDLQVKNKHPAFVIISGEDALIKMMKMTDAGRLDAFVENPNVLNYELRDRPKMQNKFKAASPNIANDQELFIAFSPHRAESKKYADILSAGMLKLRSSGKLKLILDKYKVKDWK